MASRKLNADRVALIVLLIIASSSSLSLSLSSSSSSSSSSPSIVQLRVMNYNVRQLPIFLGMINDWDQKQRLERLPGGIHKILQEPTNFGRFPEVLFFNELMTSAAQRAIKEKVSDVFPHQTSVPGAGCKSSNWDSLKGACDYFSQRSGVMAVSRLPIIERHAYVFKSCDKHTWDCKANKGAVYIKVKKDDRLFHVVGTHLQADEAGDEATAQIVRVKQMAEMKNWLDGFGIPKDEPIIIAGDLNVEYGFNSDALLDPDVYRFDFGDNWGFGSFSAKTNWLARADAFHYKYDLNYDKTLDYIVSLKSHKQPMQPAWMEIFKLQNDKSWYWKYLNREFHIPGEGTIYKDGYYNDISDHWPCVSTFTFSY